jgi:hypothetical protein
LPETDRQRVRVLTESFHESGTVNVLGRRLGLPTAIGTHNHYWMWGPGDATGEVLIVVAEPDAAVLGHFESAERTADIDCEWCMPELRRKAVFVCRRARRPLNELWPALKVFM